MGTVANSGIFIRRPRPKPCCRRQSSRVRNAWSMCRTPAGTPERKSRDWPSPCRSLAGKVNSRGMGGSTASAGVRSRTEHFDCSLCFYRFASERYASERIRFTDCIMKVLCLQWGMRCLPGSGTASLTFIGVSYLCALDSDHRPSFFGGTLPEMRPDYLAVLRTLFGLGLRFALDPWLKDQMPYVTFLV